MNGTAAADPAGQPGPPGHRDRGAYGIVLRGELADDPCLPLAPRAWPAWSLRHVLPDVAAGVPALRAVLAELAARPDPGAPVEGQADAGVEILAGGVDVIRAVGDTVVVMDGERKEITVVAPRAPSAAALIHPWLTTTAGWIAHRRGCDTFHAAGLHVGGRAWALLGAREAGKTTALTALGLRGLGVLGDDLVVLDGDIALAGPAATDLREGAAAHLGTGRREQLLEDRQRWRCTFTGAAAELPFAGFVLPAWGEQARVVAVPAAERLGLLLEHRYVLDSSGRELRLLDLAALPMLRWERPRSFDRLDAGLDALLAALAST